MSTLFLKQNMGGFTLVETLVAIAIMTIVMVAPFYAVEKALNASYAARDELIASSLAQDGVEYIREVRDNNYLANYVSPGSTPSWLYGVDGTGGSQNCIAPRKCIVDSTQQFAQQCTKNDCSTQPLYLSTTDYLYNQKGVGTPTRFYRSVQLSKVSNTEMRVTVTVTWITSNVPYTTTIVEYLDNWL